MKKEEKGENNIHIKKKRGNANEDIEDRDKLMFMNDIEEDPEMRANINLYKVSSNKISLTHMAG